MKPTDLSTREPIGMFTYPGGKLTITQLTLKTIIEEAYGVNGFQVSGGPRWLDQNPYDFVCKPPAFGIQQVLSANHQDSTDQRDATDAAGTAREPLPVEVPPGK